MTFGEFIRESRECEGLTLKELSAILDISLTSLYRIEKNGNGVSTKTFYSISKWLEVEYEYVINLYNDLMN